MMSVAEEEGAFVAKRGTLSGHGRCDLVLQVDPIDEDAGPGEERYCGLEEENDQRRGLKSTLAVRQGRFGDGALRH